MAIDDLEIFDAARDAFEEVRAERDKLRAEVDRLKEWLNEIALVASDEHPRMSEDVWRQRALFIIDKQVQKALRGENHDT